MNTIKLLEMKEVPVDEIDLEYRMRSDVRAKVDRLKESIKSIGGLIQLPVVFQKKDERYGLIVGTRRLEAFKQLGKETIPVIIIDRVGRLTAAQISLIENLRRVDPPLEDIRVACSDLAEKVAEEENVSYEDMVSEVQRRLGTTKGTAKKYLALTLMPEKIQTMVADGELTKEEAYRVYASTSDESQMVEIAELTRNGKLTLEQQEVVPEVLEEEIEIDIKRELPQRTRKRARKSLELWFPFDEYERIEKACEDLDVEDSALVRIAVRDWLERNRY